MSKLVRDYLCYTVAIMLVCWGTCLLICNMNEVSLSEVPLLYVPYLLGGFYDNIWGNIAAAVALIISAYLLGPVYKLVNPAAVSAHKSADGTDHQA